MGKKFLLFLIMGLVVIGLVSGTTLAVAKSSASDPTVSIVAIPSAVALDKKAQIAVMGSGLEPGQEVSLLLITADGVKTDLSGYLASKPVVNKAGAWSTVLKAGRYISKKLIKEGVYAISVTDDNYNSLASVPLGFYDAKKPREEWQGWAQVAVPE